jgi:hypothetical protein
MAYVLVVIGSVTAAKAASTSASAAEVSSRTIRRLAHSLTLVPAALLFQTGAAAAGDPRENVLQQPRESVVQTTATVSASPNAQRRAREAGSRGDAQEFARRLLLGVMTVSTLPNTQGNASTVRPTEDAQEFARRLLLGVANQTPGQLRPGVSGASGDRGHGDAQVSAQHLLLGRRDAPPKGD